MKVINCNKRHVNLMMTHTRFLAAGELMIMTLGGSPTGVDAPPMLDNKT